MVFFAGAVGRIKAGFSSIWRGEGFPATVLRIEPVTMIMTEARSGVEKLFIMFLSLLDTIGNADLLQAVERRFFVSGFGQSVVVMNDGGSPRAAPA